MQPRLSGGPFFEFRAWPVAMQTSLLNGETRLSAMKSPNIVSGIQDFKTEAWKGRRRASQYARDVNDRFHKEAIDLETQLRLLSSVVPEGANVADIGCGSGALAIRMAQMGFKVTGFDVSADMLNELKRRSKGLNIETVETDIFELDSTYGPFDAAISRWFMPHFLNWPEIAESVSRVLLPGAVFVFEMKNEEHDEFAKRNAMPDVNLRPYVKSKSENEAQLYVTPKESQESLEKKLFSAGYKLEARVPFGLLSGNLLLSGGLSDGDLARRTRILDKLLRRNPLLRGLIEELELLVVPNLGHQLVYRSLVVARRL